MLGDIDGAVGRDEHVGAGCNLSCIFRNTINEYVTCIHVNVRVKFNLHLAVFVLQILIPIPSVVRAKIINRV